MGEGWSDWYAMDYLVEPGLVTDTAADGEVAVGEYVDRTTPTSASARNALDCPVGSAAPRLPGHRSPPAPAASRSATWAASASTDATRRPRFEVHDDGEIWAETLWDLRTALGARDRAQPRSRRRCACRPPNPSSSTSATRSCSPTGVDGGAHRTAIWQVFANRGMGYGARTTGPSATRGDRLVRDAAASPRPAPSRSTDPAPLGDGDGVAEPGETLRLAVSLVDPGLVALTNVHATLSSLTSGVTVPSAGAGYGTIAAGAARAGDVPFQVSVPAAR